MSDANIYKGKYTFTWNIENFFSYYFEQYNDIVSPVFTIEAFSNSKWIVLFSKNTSNRSISCILQRSKDCTYSKKLKISYNFELIGSFCKLYEARTGNKKFAKGDDVELISNTCIKSQINDDEKSSGDVMTIRLELLSKDFNSTLDTECIARTKVNGDQCSFEWKFCGNKFPLYKTFPSFQGMQISLLVTSASADFVVVTFKRIKQDPMFRFLQCKITFIDVDGTKIYSKKSAVWFTKYRHKLPVLHTIANNFLKQGYSTNSFTTLQCECHISNGTSLTEMKYVQTDACPDAPAYHFQEDFQRMYQEKILSDVKLRIADEIFMAHKCVLCTRSPVFLAMFNQGMVESKTGVVDISDTDPRTFALFLKYLYISDIDFNDSEDAIKLLLCANKYQVISLKEKCSSFLVADLCEKNACEILVIADMVDMKFLKSSAIRRIEAHASRIFKSVDWNQVLESHPRLATEVLSILSAELSP